MKSPVLEPMALKSSLPILMSITSPLMLLVLLSVVRVYISDPSEFWSLIREMSRVETFTDSEKVIERTLVFMLTVKDFNVGGEVSGTYIVTWNASSSPVKLLL